MARLLKLSKTFFYLGETIGAKGGVVDGVVTNIRSRRSKFRDLVPLLASRILPLGAKGKLYSTCAGSVMLYASETWSVKEQDVIRLDRNHASMVR